MNRSIIGSVLAALLWAPEVLATDNAAAGSAVLASSERGRQLYMNNTCYSCHGSAGQGAERTGPQLAPQPTPYVAFVLQLRQPRGLMPRYPQQVLSDADVADIYAYLSAVPASPAVDSIRLLDAFR